MGLWSYPQLTSLHFAFIKLPLSKFVAPESRGRLLPKPNLLTNSSDMLPRTLSLWRSD